MAAHGIHQEFVDILVAEDVSAESTDVIAGKKILTIKPLANVVTGKDQVSASSPRALRRRITCPTSPACGRHGASARSPTRRPSSSCARRLLLPPATQLELERAFLCKYSWRKLPAGLIGCDSLLGRCQRECQRRTVTVLCITRVRNRSLKRLVRFTLAANGCLTTCSSHMGLRSRRTGRSATSWDS